MTKNYIGRLLASDDMAALVESLDERLMELETVVVVYRDTAGEIYVQTAGTEDVLILLGLLETAKDTLLNDEENDLL